MSIEVLTVENFKCFEKISVPLGRLNILSGRNGSGKSSFVQALLLYRASMIQVASKRRDIPLNAAPGLALGTSEDVLRRSAGSPASDRLDIHINVRSTSSPASLTFDTKDLDEVSNYIILSGDLPNVELFDPSPWMFQFLSAEREGPRLVQEKLSNLPIGSLTLGEHGEYAIEVLNRMERQRLREAVVHPIERGKDSRLRNFLLARNVELWMSSIFGDLQLRTESGGIHAPPSLFIREQQSAKDWAVATNFGFGISYVLPIVLAGLLIDEGGILIVDSPEAHLHPAAQTQIAKFLTIVAAAGTQVFVETHSDHVIDGFRLQVASSPAVLAANDCKFLNFEQDELGRGQIKAIGIREDGTLTEWPKGFFDQQRQNLRALASAVVGKKPDG